MEVKVCWLLNKQFGFLLKSLRGNKSVGDSASFFQSPHSSHNSNSPSTAAQKKVEAFQYEFNLCMFYIFHILCWMFIMAKTTWFSWFWGSLRLPSWYSWSCSRIKLPSRRQQATRSATSHKIGNKPPDWVELYLILSQCVPIKIMSLWANPTFWRRPFQHIFAL